MHVKAAMMDAIFNDPEVRQLVRQAVVSENAMINLREVFMSERVMTELRTLRQFTFKDVFSLLIRELPRRVVRR